MTLAAMISILPLIMLIVLTVAFLAGIWMVISSRGGGLPFASCGQCGYDVRGSIETAIRCPECGSDFLQVGITPPQRKRRTSLVVAGVTMMLLSIAALAGSFLVSRTLQVQALTAQARQTMSGMLAPTSQPQAPQQTQLLESPPVQILNQQPEDGDESTEETRADPETDENSGDDADDSTHEQTTEATGEGSADGHPG